MSEVTWISVADAAPQFGMTPGAIMNLISRNKFPVPTYKLGKKRVIDLAVLRAFFEAKKTEGLSRLAKSMNGQPKHFLQQHPQFGTKPGCDHETPSLR